jgi:O-antigen/teichoic acid export membrane protein
MLVLAILFAISIPSAIIMRLQFGIQEGHLNGITQAAGGVLSLGMIFLAVRWNLGLEGLVGIYFLAPLIASWASAVYLLASQRQLIPRVNDVDFGQMKSLLKTGMQFFLIHLAWAVGFATDNLVIAHMVGLDSVASYTVHQKLFSPLPLVAGLAMTPLWSAYAEAIARGDVNWIRRTFSIGTAVFFVLGAVAALCLYQLAEPLLQFWLNGQVTLDHDLALFYALWIVVDITGKGVAMFLNGVGEIKSQLLIVAIFAPLVLVLKVYFAQWFGAPGVPAALVVAYVVTHVPGYYIIIKRWHQENPGHAVVRT